MEENNLGAGVGVKRRVIEEWIQCCSWAHKQLQHLPAETTKDHLGLHRHHLSGSWSIYSLAAVPKEARLGLQVLAGALWAALCGQALL